jgi:1,4-dihydroxy-2-naphthoate octaprenyltransferase
MVYAIAAVVLVLWALGFFLFNIGAVIHLLIVVAVVMIVGNLIRGVGNRQPV